jgi:hypothetical protein
MVELLHTIVVVSSSAPHCPRITCSGSWDMVEKGLIGEIGAG